MNINISNKVMTPLVYITVYLKFFSTESTCFSPPGLSLGRGRLSTGPLGWTLLWHLHCN